MTSALIMALVFIVYIIQAFKIPTASMEKSLLTGDFLLGLKFLYGSPLIPFSYAKFPHFTDPKPGDVVIFEFPGNDFDIGSGGFLNKDFIKRCVAGPGQTVEIRGRDLFIDGKKFVLPPRGQFVHNGILDDPGITSFAPLRIPKKGDTIIVDGLDAREFFFLRNLIEQENPGSRLTKFWTGTVGPFARIVPVLRNFLNPPRDNPELAQSFPGVAVDFSIYLDGKKCDTVSIATPDPFGQLRLSSLSSFKRQMSAYLNDSRVASWTGLERHLDFLLSQLRERYPGRDISIKKDVYLKGKRVGRYVVKNDNYFMMGDNRDDSMDSRYWGYLNRNFVKAKAFILYFSLDSRTPWWQLPIKIRWNRMGKFIRSWNGLQPPGYYK